MKEALKERDQSKAASPGFSNLTRRSRKRCLSSRETIRSSLENFLRLRGTGSRTGPTSFRAARPPRLRQPRTTPRSPAPARWPTHRSPPCPSPAATRHNPPRRPHCRRPARYGDEREPSAKKRRQLAYIKSDGAKQVSYLLARSRAALVLDYGENAALADIVANRSKNASRLNLMPGFSAT